MFIYNARIVAFIVMVSGRSPPTQHVENYVELVQYPGIILMQASLVTHTSHFEALAAPVAPNPPSLSRALVQYRRTHSAGVTPDPINRSRIADYSEP